MTPTCPKCKSDEACGMMGPFFQCLKCGFVDKEPENKYDPCEDCYYNPQCRQCENCLRHCTCKK